MSKNWIKIYHKSFNDLSYDELYIYASLFRHRLEFKDGWKTETNVYLLESFLVKLKGSKRQRIDNITEIVSSLKSKGYICFDANSIKPNTLLHITFPVHEEEIGFNSNITYDLFDLFNDSRLFYIYCNIDRWGTVGTKISDGEWCTKLDITKTTVRKLIDLMNSDNSSPRIYKFSGDYIKDSKRQDINNYYTRPSEEIKNKWNNWYVEGVKLEDHKEPVQKKEIPEQVEIVDSNYGNWKNGNNLVDTDYDLYILNRDDPEYMVIAEKKINRISKNKTNEGLMYFINKGIEEADTRNRKNLQDEKMQKERVAEFDEILFVTKSESFTVRRDGKIIAPTIDELRNDDILLYIVEEGTQYQGERRSKLKGVTISNLIRGITSDGYSKITEDTYNSVEDYAKDLLSANKMSGQLMSEVTKHRDSILLVNNQGREHDVEHEGDVFTCYDGTTETNESLKDRKYVARMAKKREEDEVSRLLFQKDEIDLTTLFD